MTRTLTTFLAATTIASGLFAATALFAAETGPSSGSTDAQGKRADHHGMMTMMGHMDADHMKRMDAMIDGCNRMMTSMSNAPTEPSNDRPIAPKP